MPLFRDRPRTLIMLALPALAVLLGCQPTFGGEARTAEPNAQAMPVDSAGPSVTLRIGHASATNSLLQQDAEAYLALIEHMTDGKAHGQSFPNSELGSKRWLSRSNSARWRWL
jgi:TRAP-type C4-dicarboxylate transport system substrate-binding protein